MVGGEAYIFAKDGSTVGIDKDGKLFYDKTQRATLDLVPVGKHFMIKSKDNYYLNLDKFVDGKRQLNPKNSNVTRGWFSPIEDAGKWILSAEGGPIYYCGEGKEGDNKCDGDLVFPRYRYLFTKMGGTNYRIMHAPNKGPRVLAPTVHVHNYSDGIGEYLKSHKMIVILAIIILLISIYIYSNRH